MTLRFILRRCLAAGCFVFLVSSASVFLVRWAPGDFVAQARGTTISQAEAARMRARLGLDRSAFGQYLTWLSGVARFDLGTSFIDGRPVSAVVAERARNTGLLAIAALILATCLGIGIGTITGSRPDAWWSTALTQVSLVFLALPPLLTSILLIFVAASTRWLPVSGMRSAGVESAGLDVVWHSVVPVLALALPMAASFERVHAKSIEATLSEPYLLAARARGVSETRILWLAAMRPALRAVASLYGLAAAALFSGSFAVEMVTAWPGLGRLLVDALTARDVPLAAGCVAAGATILALATLCGDVLLAAVDPRAGE